MQFRANSNKNEKFPQQKLVIGIVGGLGPLSHIELERRLLEAAQEEIGASADQQFPEWIVSSLPETPDRTLAINGSGPDPTPWLVRSLKRLEGSRDGQVSGAGFAIICCNTAHYFLSSVQKFVTIPILHMIEETVKSIVLSYPQATVGILATNGTLESGLYHEALQQHQLTPVSLLDFPDGPGLQQILVMESIYGGEQGTAGGIKGQGVTSEHVRSLKHAATLLINDGQADVIIAGCTEISLALKGPIICGKPIIDPLRVIARVAIRRAYDLPDEETIQR